MLLKLPGEGVRDPGGAKVLRAAQMLARVKHPGVIRMLHVEETKAGLLQVLEPVAGEPLSERLTAPMSPAQVVALGRQLCDALQAVHHQGVVHRGLSADAVVVRPDDSVVLAGFSFAKRSGGFGLTSLDFSKKGPTEVRALPAYIAPEQQGRDVADARTDVYGLGRLLIRCLLGREAGADAFAKGGEHPPGLVQVLQRATARSPLGRYQTAREFGEALATCLDQTPAASRRGAVLLVALIAAVVGVGGVFAFGGGGGDEPVDPAPRRSVDVDTDSYSGVYAQSHALLIGVGDYSKSAEFGSLTNAANDITRLKQCLEGIGGPFRWNVETLSDPTKQQLEDALIALAGRVGVDDRVLVYFAGHGLRDAQTGRGVAALASDFVAATSSAGQVRFTTICEQVFGYPAKHRMLIFDCCYPPNTSEDPKPETRLRGRSTVADGGFEELARPRSVLVAATYSSDQAAGGRPNTNSPLVSALTGVLARRADTDSAASRLDDSDFGGALRRLCKESGELDLPRIDTEGDGTWLFFLSRPR